MFFEQRDKSLVTVSLRSLRPYSHFWFRGDHFLLVFLSVSMLFFQSRRVQFSQLRWIRVAGMCIKEAKVLRKCFGKRLAFYYQMLLFGHHFQWVHGKCKKVDILSSQIYLSDKKEMKVLLRMPRLYVLGSNCTIFSIKSA